MTKWKFRLTLQYNKEADKGWDVKGYDELIADSLTELLSKLLILVVGVQKKIHEDEMLEERIRKDDIPF